MSYQEYKPSGKLANIIDCYWVLSDLRQLENHRVLPDGCADIIFNLGAASSSTPKESVVVSGMMTTFSDVSLYGGTELLGVRFKSGQLSNFTKMPLYEIKNQTIEASDLISDFNPDILEQLASKSHLSSRLNLVESEIYHTLSKNDRVGDMLISSVVEGIVHSVEPVNVSLLADKYSIGLRQLERKFKSQVGVTMKEFATIMRFNQTKSIIEKNPDLSLLHIAFDNGYYDHSHLTNEFKRFTGQIPSDFR